jgi:hypothetical protein
MCCYIIMGRGNAKLCSCIACALEMLVGGMRSPFLVSLYRVLLFCV